MSLRIWKSDDVDLIKLIQPSINFKSESHSGLPLAVCWQALGLYFEFKLSLGLDPIIARLLRRHLAPKVVNRASRMHLSIFNVVSGRLAMLASP